MDVAGLIREAKLPERTVLICLRSDLVTIFERLQADLVAAEKTAATVDSLAAGPDLSTQRAELDELREEMKRFTVPFMVRALPRRQFRALLAAHPPRKGDDGKVDPADWQGVNNATYFDALIRATTVSPELDEETWQLLLDEKLSDAQYEALADAAFDISREKIDLPFSSTASSPIPSYDDAWSKRSDWASASNDSTAGSLLSGISTMIPID
jgi:hypothetical protein